LYLCNWLEEKPTIIFGAAAVARDERQKGNHYE
jgi:hypothetical protein